MKKILKNIALFLILQMTIFSAEFISVGTQSYNVSSYNLRYRTLTHTPEFIWRKYGETINEKFLIRAEAGRISNRYDDNPIIGWYNVRTTMKNVHSGIRYTYKNLSLVGTKQYFSDLGTLNTDINRFSLDGIVIDSNIQLPVSWYASIEADTYLSVDWSVPDGTYTMQGNTRVEWNGASTNYSSSRDFTLITYLDIQIDDIDFGQVIFTKNAPIETRSTNITFTGGQSKKITAILNDDNSILRLKKVGGNETIPINVNLRYGSKKGTTLIIDLDSMGSRNAWLDATLNPGLYFDVPEGKYTGELRVNVKYN